MKKLTATLASFALLAGTCAMPAAAAEETVVHECYKVYVYGAMRSCYYNARTDQWFTPDGELLVVEQEPVMEARYQGETVYVDITTQTVYTAENEVHQELTDVLPKMLDYPYVSCACLPRGLDVTFPILYDFKETSLDFSFDYAFVEEGNTLGGVSYGLSYEGDGYEIFPWENNGDYPAEVYPTMGDITADGALTIVDAIILSRLVAQDTTLALTPLQQSLADVDADGYILAEDITAVLQTLAGLTT